mmetsp:Transcript_28435/g.84080  ORF Transcript_28435/g.84080 Transcript_28435/m.84080 type:complete len:224 (-) Transcript_28435:549-1220(-)
MTRRRARRLARRLRRARGRAQRPPESCWSMCTRRREDERDREGEREGLSERERREDSSQLRPTWSGLPSPQANEPPVARLPTSQPPAEWERLWKGSDWLCTEVGGDWSAFLYAQGVSWLLVNAMGATNWGVGSEMKLHMPSWREMHGEAFMRGLPSVPGVDTHQWQHYYYDWQPYVASIPLAPDQAWRGAWLEDGTPAGRLEVSRAATLDPSPRGGLLPRPLP